MRHQTRRATMLVPGCIRPKRILGKGTMPQRPLGEVTPRVPTALTWEPSKNCKGFVTAVVAEMFELDTQTSSGGSIAGLYAGPETPTRLATPVVPPKGTSVL